MNCQHAQKDMQEALDRRLPQSRQRAFQEHILACKPCRLEFDQFKKLQAWTQELPSTKPSANFSQRLFERIQSGEGSPEGVLLQPVSMTRKLRIFGSGAVTAAAVMLGIFLIQETLGGPRDDGSINFNRTEPNPLYVSDPVKSAEFAINNVVASYETAQGLQAVPQLNQRTLESIRSHGEVMESYMAHFEELLRRGEIRLAVEGRNSTLFYEHMERLQAQAWAMRRFPQEWLQQQAADRRQGSDSVLFIIHWGQGIDPSTRQLRRVPIMPGKAR